MDKTDRLRNYGLAFLLYKQGLGVCGYELIRELFIFIKLILNSYLNIKLDFHPCATNETDEFFTLRSSLFTYFFSASKSSSSALSGSSVSLSKVTNLLPMMAPAALSWALVRVCLLLIPKPIIRGLRSFIPLIWLK